MNNNSKILIYHKEKYLTDILKKVLHIDNCRSYNNIKSMINSLDQSIQRVIIVEDNMPDILEIVEQIIIKRKYPIIIHLWTLNNTDRLWAKIQKEMYFPECNKYNCSQFLYPLCLTTMNIDDLRIIIRKDPNGQIAKKDWGNLAADIVNRHTKRQDQRQRHKYDNLRAAARILNGALASGDYDLSDKAIYKNAINAYEHMVLANHRWDEIKKKERMDDAVRTIDYYLQKNKILYNVGLDKTDIPQLTRVLVIDDQIEVWRPVWEFIFSLNNINVDFMSSGKDVVKQICRNEYDCVLLDVDLGESNENGISVLQRIKNEQFELPVVMITAYDDAEITRICYGYGAEFCFVKEREDKEDRDSLDYFNMIKKILTVPLYNSQERGICRRFRAIEVCLENEIYSESLSYLRQAIFYLLLRKDDLTVSYFIENDSERNQLVCYNAYRAFQKAQGPFASIRNVPNQYYAEIEKIEVYLKKYATRYGHRSFKQITIDKTLNILNKVILWFKINISINNISEVFKSDFTPKTHSVIAIESADNESIGHANRAKAGAVRLIQGAYLANNDVPTISDRFNIKKDTLDDIINLYDELKVSLLPNHIEEIKYHSMLIDDDGIDSGWHMALSLLMPDTYVHYIEYKAGMETTEITNILDGCDVVFLDLRLPDEKRKLSEETGIKILQKIKEKNVSIPVIVLTASDDAYWFRKSLQNGAFDIFPKTNESFFRVDNNKYYTTYFEKFNELIYKIKLYLNSENIDVWRHIDLLTKSKYTEIINSIEIKKEHKLTHVPKIVEEAKKQVSSAIKKAYFLNNCHQNSTLEFPIKRLLYSNIKGNNFKGLSAGQAFLNAVQAVEYYARFLATLYDENKAFDTGNNLGSFTKPYCLPDEIWKENPELKKDLESLWERRNKVKSNILTISDSNYLKEAIFEIYKIQNALRKKIKYKLKEDVIRSHIREQIQTMMINQNKYLEEDTNISLFGDVNRRIKKDIVKIKKGIITLKDISNNFDVSDISIHDDNIHEELNQHAHSFDVLDKNINHSQNELSQLENSKLHTLDLMSERLNEYRTKSFDVANNARLSKRKMEILTNELYDGVVDLYTYKKIAESILGKD